MDNHEDIFAEEAQEETILSERRRNHREPQSKKVTIDVNTPDATSDEEGETSPLISSPKRRQRYQRATSYERAINQPWTGAHGAGELPWYKRPSVYWLLPAFLPFCIAFGGIIVPKTYLIQDLICRDLFRDRSLQDPTFTFAPIEVGGKNDQCGTDDAVQSKTAMFQLWTSLLSGIASAIVAPHLGALSDRIGRKKVIVGATFGAFAAELLTIAVGTMPDKLSVYWILVGYVFDGFCGSFTTSMALCFAYASDCTAPERRNVAFGHFHANLFAGIAIGPIVAGAMIKATKNIMTPFYFALGCHVFFILFTAICVPESLSKERRKIASEKRREARQTARPTRSWSDYNIFAPLWVLWPKGEGSSKKLRRNLFVLAAIDTMMFGVAMGTLQILLIYARKRFDWDSVAASGFMSIVNVCRVLGLLLILPVLTRLVRGRGSPQTSGHRGSDMLDINIIRVTVVFDMIGYIGYALTPSPALFVLSGIIASLGGIGPPTLQSSMTKHLPADMTGQVLGASGLLHALARVVAPVVFNLIYSKTVRFYAGLVFLCLASIFVIVFILSWFLKPGVHFQENSTLDHADEPDEVDRDE